MAAMGFTAHTATPFKASPFSPPHFWFCYSCHSFSPSRPFRTCSGKSLHRGREDYRIQGPKSSFAPVAIFCSSFQSGESTTYYSTHCSESNSHNKLRHFGQSSSSSSPSKPNLRFQTDARTHTSTSWISSHSSSTSYPNTTRLTWTQVTDEIKESRKLYVKKKVKNNAKEVVFSSGKVMTEDVRDDNAFKDATAYGDFYPVPFVCEDMNHDPSDPVTSPLCRQFSVPERRFDTQNHDGEYLASGCLSEYAVPSTSVPKSHPSINNGQVHVQHGHVRESFSYRNDNKVQERYSRPANKQKYSGNSQVFISQGHKGKYIKLKNYDDSSKSFDSQQSLVGASSIVLSPEYILENGTRRSYKDPGGGADVTGLNGSAHPSTQSCTVNGIPRKQTTAGEKVKQIDPRERLASIYDKVLVVDSVSSAEEVVRMLTTKFRHLVHACDTEVSKIDVKRETPVDHGEIICFSIYSGPEASFGNGKSCIWVDVLDGGGEEILAKFEPFFKDQSIKKVWHNYSFDNHVIENYGFKLSGFHADTMHMARLWDSSRRTEGGYSLEALTGDSFVMSGTNIKVSGADEELIGKVSMKTIFGRRKVKKDGSEGKVITIPSVEELQKEERKLWICYSALDSISTLKLYESLKSKLSKQKWKFDGIEKGSLYDFYEEYWRPFGELLVKMETEGMLVDRDYLAEIEKVAKAEQQVAADRFRNWASKHCPDAKYMNVGSDAQLRQLFFGGIQNRKDANEYLPVERDFKIPNVDNVIEEGKKVPTKYRKITLRNVGCDIQTDMYTASGWPSVSGDALKTLAGKVSGDFEPMDEVSQLQSDDIVEELPEADGETAEVERTVSSGDLDTSAYGLAYAAFGGGPEGIEACHAIAALCDVCSIDSLISNFILPLQGCDISGKNGRIHCSLNINTETGRLSARRPNLQNQPALEKDRYKIRQAFIAAPGNSLLVADYGQLELRILAHLANCKSMLDAFKAGGDFHSRTAMNMYPYIREAVERKHVLLEWHPQPGEDKPPVPLLKDEFASERRKAKMLNFSIAYGKTAVGLSRDWKVSVEEAKRTVDLWYSDRKEVLTWQEQRKKEARETRRVHTLLGRARLFPSLKNATHSHKSHIERAAINTPVQGSAADVAMCAMLQISRNKRLKKLGWKLLLQVHDEVILEGPEESAEVAKAIVVDCMSKPFNGKNILKVGLSVDAKCAKNWYSAK